MKQFFVLIFSIFSLTTLWAQSGSENGLIPLDTSYWEKSSKINLNIQQVGLFNWAAGGESSIAIGSVFEARAKYEKDLVVWDNQIRLGYGVLRQGETNNRFEKTDDIFLVTSQYSQKFSENVLMTAALRFQTQMDKGFKLEDIPNSSEKRRVLISNFLAPGYLQASLGLTYRNKKNFDMTLSPFTGRFTFVASDSLSNIGSFGVNPGEKFRAEAGISFNSSIEAKLMKNVDFKASVNLFSNYEKFPNTVVNGLAEIILKVNDYIASNISTQIIYDDDVLITLDDGSRGKRLQIKNVINVGLSFSF